MKRNNIGPRETVYRKKPKSRSIASKVWVSAYARFGAPPSFLHYVPANRWTIDAEGKDFLTKTTMWIIGYPDNEEEKIYLNGTGRAVCRILEEGTE